MTPKVSHHKLPWFHSIRFKLVITAVVVELCMLGILLANSYRLVNTSLESQTRARLEALTPLLNASLAGYVFQRDHSEVKAIIKDLSSSHFTEIRYIVVSDYKGQTIASASFTDKDADATQGVAEAPLDHSVEDALSDLVYDTQVPLTMSGNDLGSVRFGLSLAGMVSLRDSVLGQSLLIAAVEVVLTLVLLTSGGYLLTRHLSTLLVATRRVTSGDYGSRINIGGKDEIGVLAHDFNTMAEAVQSRMEAQRAASEALRESEASFRSIFDNVSDAIFVHDVDSGRLINVNRRMCEMFGFDTREAAIAVNFDQISAGVAPYTDMEARAHLRNAIDKGPQTFEWHARNTRGELFWVEVSVRLSHIGEESRLLSVMRDISERKKADEMINELAFYDPLTGLPNRRLLVDRLKQAVASGGRNARQFALLFIDLDNFKTLNDTRGHHIGDLLLKEVSTRLSSCVREGDTVARLGGDEFVVVLEGLSGIAPEAVAQTKNVSEKILATLNAPYQLDGHKHLCTSSIGITLISDHHGTVDELLQQADLAMYQSKASGRNTIRFFDPEMQAAVTIRANLEVDLREGIRDGQFLLYYQPQLDASGRIFGVEALIRWRHPQRGMVSPAEFIPLAEDTGLILPIGHWVLETACATLNAWAEKPEMAHLIIAVNVSASQFHQPDFVAQVLSVLDHNNVDASKLKLELTESMLVSNVDDIIIKMTALKAKGISFSLDDFGTGYSSLSYLKRLPLDQLKIDQGFVRDIMYDANDAAIAKTIIALAESLGLHVIAEGVETETQREFLASQGCHAYQGYLFSRPLPLQEFEALVTRV
jgi:diguanylate cyclase (GGDEF)-like protein/PAS domain S-box-containing protein